jgi:hypothetical protein
MMRWLFQRAKLLLIPLGLGWASGFPSLSLDATAQDKATPSARVADADLVSWVDQRIVERQVPAADRRFDEIGWAKDIRHAKKLAREHNRPVFLFTHDGRMNLGRC